MDQDRTQGIARMGGLAAIITAMTIAWAAGLVPLTARADDAAGPAAPVPAVAGAQNQPCLGEATETDPAALEIDPMTSWQPRGGEIRFSLTTRNKDIPANLVVCFRWSGPGDHEWRISPLQRTIERDGKIIHGALVPMLDAAPAPVLARMIRNGGMESDALGLVPVAEMRVLSPAGKTPRILSHDRIGITNRYLSLAFAVILVVVALETLKRIGMARLMQGNTRPYLQIITTRDGYASLSQLQIILWSFLIGAAVVYVMILSGGLITIPDSALILLGISGLATLGSKVGSLAEDRARPPAAPPGSAVSDLQLNGPPGSDEIRVAWLPPAAPPGRPDAYRVRARIRPADGTDPPWTCLTQSLPRPGFRLVGLTAATCHQIEVTPLSGGTAGVASVIEATTAAAPAPPAAAGERPLHCNPTRISNHGLTLGWAAAPGMAPLVLGYRRHDSDDEWRDSDGGATGASLDGLEALTRYDLRLGVRSQGSGSAGSGQTRWGPVITIATPGPRLPRWSDLVIATDGSGEIDVTRIQMLFFTLIVALFVCLRVIGSMRIPDIPEGYLVLMGLSNGVYLGAKFISR